MNASQQSKRNSKLSKTVLLVTIIHWFEIQFNYSLIWNYRCSHVLSLVFTVVEAKCGIVRPESTTFSEDNNSDREIEDVLETIPEPSPGVQGFSHPAFPSPEPLPQPLKSLAGLGLTKASCFVCNSFSPVLFHMPFSCHVPLYDRKDPATEMEPFKVMIQNGVIIRAIYVHDSDL